MKHILLVLMSSALFAVDATAKDDIPNGYMPLEKLAEAQAKARQSKKLVTITAKGFDELP